MDRLSQSIDNLFSIIEEQKQEKSLLGSLIRILAKGVSGMEPYPLCGVLTDPGDIPDYLLQNDCDYMVLLTPGVLTVLALDREAIDRMLETGELAAWIDANWVTGAMAITVP